MIMEQIKDVESCLVCFEAFIRAAAAESKTEVLRPLAQQVLDAEAVADRSLRRMIDSLDGKYLPATKEDLISVATSCDHVANKCENVAKMIVYQRISLPAEYRDEILEIIAITHRQFEVLEKTIHQMFAAFGALLKDHAILDDIRAYEGKVDRIENGLLERTFELELELARQVQLANVIESICDLSDIIENVADKIQIMLISRKA